MSFVKNKRPIETFTYANGYEMSRWRKSHTSDCRSHCPCCAGEWDCTCGAVTWRPPALAPLREEQK